MLWRKTSSSSSTFDSTTVSRNTFMGNFTVMEDTYYEHDCGALYVDGDEIILSENIFNGNTAVIDAGAVEVDGPATIVNNLFLNNSAGVGLVIPSPDYYYGLGGALFFDSTYETTITNNTFVGNSANYGGGIYVQPGYESGTVVSIYNNIFWGNTTVPVPGSTYPSAQDLLVYVYNVSYFPTINLYNNTITDFYTDVATLNQADNITANPQLDGDAHLTSLSPCIEVGYNNAPGLSGIAFDIDGDPRIADNDGDGTATIDMGADEYVGVLVRYDLTASVSGGIGIISPTSGTYIY